MLILQEAEIYERVRRTVDTALRSSFVPTVSASLHGLLYLLQGGLLTPDVNDSEVGIYFKLFTKVYCLTNVLPPWVSNLNLQFLNRKQSLQTSLKMSRIPPLPISLSQILFEVLLL